MTNTPTTGGMSLTAVVATRVPPPPGARVVPDQRGIRIEDHLTDAEFADLMRARAHDIARGIRK